MNCTDQEKFDLQDDPCKSIKVPVNILKATDRNKLYTNKIAFQSKADHKQMCVYFFMLI